MRALPVWLFVDDDPNFLSVLVEMFDQWVRDSLGEAPKVLTAGNVADALMVLQKEAVEVMVVDIRMPGVDGLQLLKLVQRKYPQVRKAVLTGFGDPQMRAMAMQAGATEFFNKPLTSEDLGTLLQQMLELALPEAHQPSIWATPAEAKVSRRSQKIPQVPGRESLGGSAFARTSLRVVEPAEEAVAEPVAEVAHQRWPAEETSSGTGMAGLLPDISMPELVQMLSLGNRKVKLRVSSGRSQGEMVISEGRVIWAQCDELTGDEAAIRLLVMPGGAFVVEPYKGGLTPNVNRSCEAILLEAAQRLDEKQAAGSPELRAEEEVIKRDLRKVTSRIAHKHRRKVVIIEEESDSAAEVETEERIIRKGREGTSASEVKRLWRELIVSDRTGRLIFEHGVGEAARRLDLIEFLTFKSATILEKTGGRRVVRIEMVGEDWRGLAGLGDEHSFFAIASDPSQETEHLLAELPPQLGKLCSPIRPSLPR